MNKVMNAAVTTLVVITIILALLFLVFKLLIIAINRDINENMNNFIHIEINSNKFHDLCSNKKMDFNSSVLERFDNVRSNFLKNFKEKLESFDNFVNGKNNDQNLKNKKVSPSKDFLNTANKLNKEKSNQDSFYKLFSALDFALDWPVLDYSAKKFFVKVLQYRLIELSSEIKKMNEFSFANDAQRIDGFESFSKIIMNLVFIEFALHVAEERKIKSYITSNKELLKSINDIYNDLALKANEYKMQMVDENGNLMKEEKRILISCFNSKETEKFLPKFIDKDVKPKDIEINKCLFISSIFKSVYELKSQFSSATKD